MDFGALAKHVGRNVRRARWAAGLTIEELAAKTGSYRLIGELERGQGNPTLKTLDELARVLKVTIADLVDVGVTPRDYIPLRKRDAVEPKRGRKPRPARRSGKAP